ncbi:alpha-L-fucosidase-like [Pectinophora gossypiella]|uniref:alpha-L-fucosidase-like n=1 Tax=Pectinophora gossypiella TaxID=13191 RepID=UPI00214F02D3|nr:alpha-L-fucosidase-like [Pectinophora gossypiella]
MLLNVKNIYISKKMKAFLVLAIICVVSAKWIESGASEQSKPKTLNDFFKDYQDKDANDDWNKIINSYATQLNTLGKPATINVGHKNNKVKAKRYKPDWKDLDSRPLPEWYDRAKIGIFIHWGVFSVPSFHSEWFWYFWKSEADKDITKFMEKNYPPGFSYQEFAPMFTAEFFDAKQWATLFAKSGAKYVVLTSKHHEGFTMFPSKQSFSWNSVDVGPHRDIVGELGKAIRQEGLRYGLYHSLYEWYNPKYLSDHYFNFTRFTYPQEKLWPDLKQLINDYHPSVIWSDGDWEAKDTYWNSTELLAWLYNDSPVKDYVVVNDRWGKGTECHHGDFYNCQDRYDPGKLQKHKWENAFTIDRKSWGYRRNIEIKQVYTMENLLSVIIRTVSCGGNALINIGPTKEGTIAPIFQERLLALGDWLKLNGEAIYDTSPWLHQNDSINNDVWYTCTKNEYNGVRPTAVPRPAETVTAIYALLTDWPNDDQLKLKDIVSLLHSGGYEIRILGQKDNLLKWEISDGQVVIQLPRHTKSKYAWALKIIKN